MVNDDIYEYDSLFDNDPDIQKKVAKGEARGEVKGAQKKLADIVEFRFPELTEAVQQRASTIESIEMLSQLTKQIAFAKDEQTARWVLDTYTAA